ncbi:MULTISPECIES: glycosyltransferase family 4 protein [unclassified Shewanella]|uniref:glycosyltransferase family 4 protein n=1 Tax=unclassified Shewanella TaxID=196818 RepID=UPI0039B56AA7
MSIWYIHPYSGSHSTGMSYRPYYLAKNFNDLGYKTTIISSLNHHLSSFDSGAIGVNKFDGVDYFLVKTPKYKGNGVGRILNMLSFGYRLFLKDFFNFAESEKPKVIIASTAHPFHIFAAFFYAKKYKAKFILEVRDLWPLSLQELVGLSKFHPLCILVNLCQKFGYRYCDICVSLLSNSKEFLVGQGLSEYKFFCIPNGYQVENKQNVTSDDSSYYPKNELVRRLKKMDFVIGYAGALGLPNNMMPLLQVAKLVKENDKFSLGVVIVGDGGVKNSLVKFCQENNLTDVHFVDPVPKLYVEKFLTLCDCLFINALPKKIYKYGISPNKIFDYMMLNKPILNGLDAPFNPMAEAGVEVFFMSSSECDLLNKIEDLLTIKKSKSLKYDSKSLVVEKYSYDALARSYIRLFESNL